MLQVINDKKNCKTVNAKREEYNMLQNIKWKEEEVYYGIINVLVSPVRTTLNLMVVSDRLNRR